MSPAQRKLEQGSVKPIAVLALDPVTGNARFIEVDNLFDALLIQTIAHHNIHEGVTYTATNFGESVADNGFVDLYLVVGGTKNAHLSIDVRSGGDSRFFLYEGATYTSPGAITERNVNRQVGDGGNETQALTATNSTTGAEIFNDFFPGGAFGTASGASGQARAEHVLKKSTVYLLRIQNIAGTAQSLSIVAEWYEK